MSVITPLLDPLVRHQPVSAEALQAAIVNILNGEEEPMMISALLVALTSKGETASDIGAAVSALRQQMTPLTGIDNAIDIVGTGGDHQNTYNISTTTALVVASCGVKVAKHGNRAASSISGASDVLTALGVGIKFNPETVREAIEKANIAFLWAPLFHPGMRFAGPVRSALKLKTIFNFVGPLCNPAGVERYLLGCSSAEKLPMMVEVLQQHGAKRVWGVYGDLGLDEISITGENRVVALEDGRIHEFSIHPRDAGLDTHPIESIRGGTPEENAAALRRLLEGEVGGYRDMVLLNAAAALVIAETAEDLKHGAALAAQAIDSGQARRTLEQLITLSPPESLPPNPPSK